MPSISEYQKGAGFETRNIITVGRELIFKAQEIEDHEWQSAEEDTEICINIVECIWPLETRYYLVENENVISHIRPKNSTTKCFRIDRNNGKGTLYTECIRFTKDDDGVLWVVVCDIEGQWNNIETHSALAEYVGEDPMGTSVETWLARNGTSEFARFDQKGDADFERGNMCGNELQSARYYRPNGFQANLVPIAEYNPAGAPRENAHEISEMDLYVPHYVAQPNLPMHTGPEALGFMIPRENAHEISDMDLYVPQPDLPMHTAREAPRFMTMMGHTDEIGRLRERIMDLEEENAYLRGRIVF